MIASPIGNTSSIGSASSTEWMAERLRMTIVAVAATGRSPAAASDQARPRVRGGGPLEAVGGASFRHED